MTRSTLAFVLAAALLLSLAMGARAAINLTDTTNISLAASQVEVGGDTTDNPDVTGGLGGPLLAYTENGLNAYGCCGGRAGTFGIANLNDGDVGIGNASDGTYAIPTPGAGAVLLDFGTTRKLLGVAVYNGYGNRDDGTYTLKDAANNTLGAWTISATGGASNAGVDSFWLTFNTPVTTNQLVMDTTGTDVTNSFREIQVFGTAAPVVTLDATQLALGDGATVTNWGGQTAGGTPTYLTNQTPNGLPAVQFNGTDRMGDNIFIAPDGSDFIIAAVIRSNNIGVYHNIIDDDAQNRPMLWVDTAFDYEFNFGGGGGAKDAGAGPAGWDIVIADSRTGLLYVNSPTANATGGGAVPFTVGEAFDFLHRDGAQTFQGLVAEIRVYNTLDGFNGDFGALYDELRVKWFVEPPVPEPASLGLLSLASLGLLRRRCRA